MNKITNTLVTVGIPVVKSKYLSAALESALNQKYNDLEIIVLNNAHTVEIADEIENIVLNYFDLRIKYYRNSKQLPMIENWNLILEYATGEYFSILCDDDMWEEGFIQNLIVLSKKYPSVNIFHSRVLIIDDKGRPVSYSPSCPETEDCLDFIYHRIRGLRYHFLSDFMVKTQALEKIKGFVNIPDGWGSDDITWFKLAIEQGIAFDAEPLLIYRQNMLNVSNNKNVNNKIESISIYINHIFSIISRINETSSFNVYRKNMIIRELKHYRKRMITGLNFRRLQNIRFIPKMIIPLLILIYNGLIKKYHN